MIFVDNAFIEVLLPKLVLRRLSEAEMNAYRQPFLQPESRLPMLVWPRELPIEGEPADVVAIVEDYDNWMATNSIPKLFVAAEPGSLLIARRAISAAAGTNKRRSKCAAYIFFRKIAPTKSATHWRPSCSARKLLFSTTRGRNPW